MANERLRAALLQRGETLESLAQLVEVDPKTVERWIGGRVPYRRTRYKLATHLEMDEAYLWPGEASSQQHTGSGESELIQLHPNRSLVPAEVWTRLFDEAEEEIDILVYAGMFLAENAGLMALLRARAADGVRIRLLFGDPDSAVVHSRGTEEGIDAGMAFKINNALLLHERLIAMDGVQVRLHSTTLYNSIYRGDDDLLVNPHLYGVMAYMAPVLHLRHVDGGTIVSTYLESFERVWASARPLPART